MKKRFIFLSLLALLLFSSCATLPKTANPGETLVIGRVQATFFGYKQFEDVKLNGTHLGNCELTLTDLSNNKTKTLYIKGDGFYCIKGLEAGNRYTITHVKIQVYGNSGASQTQNLDIPQQYQKIIVPVADKVVNIGCTFYTFDGTKNWASWNTDYYQDVRNMFKELDPESEWHNREIIDQR